MKTEKIKADAVIVNAQQVVTLKGFSERPKMGEEMNEVGIVEGGAVAIREDEIVWVGSSQELSQHVLMPDVAKQFDAHGKTVIPGLIDTHNHLIFSGSRENEFVQRAVEGLSYLEIAQQGGGVANTVSATRRDSAETLYAIGKKRVRRMLKEGTTSSEAKSGYGFNLETEVKMLEVIAALDEQGPLDLVPTFLAHGIAPEFKGKTDAYVEVLTKEIIPAVAEKRLAKFCDVAFAPGRLFSDKQSETILRCGADYGMKARVHADEFKLEGGAEFAARVGAHTIDHCVHSNDAGIRALKDSGVIVNLMPTVPLNLKFDHYANARKMIEVGIPVALGSDFNPSCFNHSMLLAVALACLYMRMTPAEALSAATINAAHSVGAADKIGSIEAGKKADLLILDAPNYVYLPYSLGSNLIDVVFKNGMSEVCDKNVE